MAIGFFHGASDVGSVVFSFAIETVMLTGLVVGLWYGYLVFRVNTAKKREVRTAADQRRIQLLEKVERRNGRVETIFDRLIRGPMLILGPAFFLGWFVALVLGSFQRYFSVDEFEAVQLCKCQAWTSGNGRPSV
jgi:hypothetical protein